MHDGAEEDAGAGQEAWDVEGLEDRVPAPLHGVGVEEELRRRVLEDLLGGPLQEDLGVRTHGEGGDGLVFPVWQGRVEADDVVLEGAEAEGADRVVGADAGVVRVVDVETGGGESDVGDDVAESEAGVGSAVAEEGGRFAFDEGVKATGIEDVVVLLRILVECGVVVDHGEGGLRIARDRSYTPSRTPTIQTLGPWDPFQAFHPAKDKAARADVSWRFPVSVYPAFCSYVA